MAPRASSSWPLKQASSAASTGRVALNLCHRVFLKRSFAAVMEGEAGVAKWVRTIRIKKVGRSHCGIHKITHFILNLVAGSWWRRRTVPERLQPKEEVLAQWWARSETIYSMIDCRAPPICVSRQVWLSRMAAIAQTQAISQWRMMSSGYSGAVADAGR